MGEKRIINKGYSSRYSTATTSRVAIVALYLLFRQFLAKKKEEKKIWPYSANKYIAHVDVDPHFDG